MRVAEACLLGLRTAALREINPLFFSALLPDTEIAEHDVQQVIETDASGDSSNGVERYPDMFSAQLRFGSPDRLIKAANGFIQRLTVPSAREDGRVSGGELSRSVPAQRLDEFG